jgi:hypothetical protein
MIVGLKSAEFSRVAKNSAHVSKAPAANSSGPTKKGDNSMIKFSNRILTAEEGAEQDAEFAKEHFDFREESPESEPAQPETTNALIPADRLNPWHRIASHQGA